MSLSHGTLLGPYEIVAAVGAGGMGEVYKARDTRLGRTVAIKVLPPGAATDPDPAAGSGSSRAKSREERRRRFEQEARAVAALNHPHICTLYDVGRDGGTDYLVMELVAGETLAARLTKGPLPSAQAIELATQMAQALARAHGEGIVHRDLKPGNVMLTESGVKLLDFGLAKLTAAGTLAADLSSLPTEASPITGQGTIVGTLAYMAPEQLEGKDVDARTDLFAFGAVLYEMLTGRRPFEGSTQASLITAIMSADPPPLTSFEPLTPPALDRVVRKCLAKDPRARWQSATDLADELKWVSTGSGSSVNAAGVGMKATPRRRVWPWAVAAGALVVGAAAVATWWLVHSRGLRVPPEPVKHTQITFSGDVLLAALSPDGATIAYVAGARGTDERLMVRDVAAGQAVEVWRGRMVVSIVWTPDGKQILVVGFDTLCANTDRKTFLVPRFGGAPRRITGLDAAYLTVSPDGRQVAGASADAARLRVMALEGGPVRAVHLPGLSSVQGLRWSQTGRRVAVVGYSAGYEWGVWVVNPDGGDIRRVYTARASSSLVRLSVAWSPSDDILYVQSRTAEDLSEVWRISTDNAESPRAVPVLTGPTPSTSMATSADGERLMHVRVVATANLWRLNLTGPAATPTPITKTSGALRRPRVSPDGLAIAAVRSGEVVEVPMEGGDPIPLPRGNQGVWSPDGQRATEVEDALPGNDDVLWLPDGRLAWQDGDPQHWIQNYRILDLATGKRELLIEKPVGWTLRALFSPEGNRVALYWNRNPFGLWLVSGPEHTERFLALRLVPAGWSLDAQWI
jgi:Tol biopolymer transport system component